ncbi:Uncharacterized iron-regulated membrane protein [Moraxella cuniculi DSM 21768]|uniref:Uncharacterized iron-regulated membrane protein n=1 Tax=Moraxella cuniculi DSM 21768 TaxID=1122245 RepID=A0A1N7EMN8_9GAMM|nr:PepSY domain-containing protein [Moraxella cuniculi]OOS07745.1 hypothetical protein B0189_02475 [Moraxella cuniculi]SIR89337.1 Uncharacterized iron-regulated membrane protein [Moraxella cuniculi DSM 21768]
MTDKHHTQKASDSAMYFTLWRWHFYAGIFVAPFLIILASTGLAMLLLTNISGKDLDRTVVNVQATTATIEQQAASAINSVTAPDVANAQVVQYISPRAADTVALFRIKAEKNGGSIDNMVLVDPYTATVIDSFPRQSNWYYVFDSIHGDILLGTVGDYLLETAASLTILLIITGLYLWWHRQRNLKTMLLPKAQPKRSLWRVIHGTLGSWVSVILLFFCITGLAWAGIWGEKMMQAWNQFPAGKWGVEPLPQSALVVDFAKKSTPRTNSNQATTHEMTTHGKSLNDGGSKDAPWVLEQTPMPISNQANKQASLPTLNSINQQAQMLGFQGRYQIYQPKGETGVWTISQDSMSYDMASPTADRTVHIDQYSGAVLADIRFDDYNAMGKFMAAGIALHMGTLDWWSVLANAVFCLLVIVLCIAGYVLWWQRRPTAGLRSLNPPARNKVASLSWQFAIILPLLAALFPTALVAVMVIALLDWLLISRIDWLKQLLK